MGKGTVAAVLQFENRFGDGAHLGKVELSQFDALNLSTELIRRRGTDAARLPLHAYSVLSFTDADGARARWASSDWQTVEVERLRHYGNFLAAPDLIDDPVSKTPAEVFLDRAAVWQIRPASDKLTGHLTLDLLHIALIHLTPPDAHRDLFHTLVEDETGPALAAGWAAAGMPLAGRDRCFPQGLVPADLELLLSSDRRSVREHAVTALARVQREGPTPRRR